MCKYCNEIGKYNGYGESPSLLNEEVSFGRNYGWLYNSYIRYDVNKGPTWRFAIETTDGYGGISEDYVYIGEFQIQYCPFCGRNILKELAE